MKLNIYNTPDEVLAALAEHFATLANSYIKNNGKFTVALSGGSSPKKLYELLASAYKDKIDWDRLLKLIQERTPGYLVRYKKQLTNNPSTQKESHG